MQALIAVVLVSFALGLASADIDREKAKKIYDECKAKTGATESEEDIIDKKIIPTTDAGKCLIECALSAKGVLKDGKIDIEGSKKIIEKIHADNPEKVAESVKGVEECANNSYEGLDKCSYATAYYECTIKKLKPKKD